MAVDARVGEEYPPAFAGQEPHGVVDHRDALGEHRPERLGDVPVPGLADHTDHLGVGREEIAKHRAVLGSLEGAPSHPERGERGVAKRLAGGQPEELRVARVRARPSTLDVREPQLVQLVQDPQTVLGRVGETHALRAVAERGVVELDPASGVRHRVAPSTTRSPTSGVL